MTESDRQAEADGCYFDAAAAERVHRFARRCCPHTKGRWAGKPFTFLDWQRERLIDPLFGWKRPDGTRRFRRAYVEIPKKNGKSTVCAVMAMYLLCGDGEPGAEVYGAALDRQQASIVFREAMLMARKSPVLGNGELRIKESAKTMYHDASGSLFRCLSADAGRQEGLNMHGLIFDEFHVQPNRKLADALEFSGASRTQPLTVMITTAGDDVESVCYEERTYAQEVFEGKRIDTSYLPLIYSAGPDDDPDDPATWHKANPSLGVTITLDSFREDWKRAKRSVAAWNAFLRYRLNRWIDSVSTWLGDDLWNACDAAPIIPEGATVYGGLDMSSTTDLTAFALWHPPTGSVLVWYWVPEAAFIEREKRNKTRIDAWAREELMTPIPGAMIDQERVYSDIVEICRRYKVGAIGADPYNAVELLRKLRDNAGLNVISYRQGMMHMSPPMKQLEARIRDGKVRHGGNPVLAWNVRNIAVKTDEAENIRPAKNKCADKIDGFVAWLMAEGVAMQADPESIYERIGLR